MLGYNLVATPQSGHFNVTMVRRWLAAAPDCLADPLGKDMFMLCGRPEGIPSTYRRRIAGLATHTVLVHPGDDMVIVNQELTHEAELRSALSFLRWLTGTWPSRIREDGYQDLSGQVADHGLQSLYPPSVVDLPEPGTDRLIRIGFFTELEHGDSEAFALSDLLGNPARPAERLPNEDLVASYLESGHRLRTATGLAFDVLDDSEDDIAIGPPHLLTDGRYVWPADLPYYLRRYHVPLLASTLIHFERQGYRVPTEIDLASLPL